MALEAEYELFMGWTVQAPCPYCGMTNPVVLISLAYGFSHSTRFECEHHLLTERDRGRLRSQFVRSRNPLSTARHKRGTELSQNDIIFASS